MRIRDQLSTLPHITHLDLDLDFNLDFHREERRREKKREEEEEDTVNWSEV